MLYLSINITKIEKIFGVCIQYNFTSFYVLRAFYEIKYPKKENICNDTNV